MKLPILKLQEVTFHFRRGILLVKVFMIGAVVMCGTRWRSWFRQCATSREVAGSIPDGVIGIFLWHNSSGLTMTLTASDNV